MVIVAPFSAVQLAESIRFPSFTSLALLLLMAKNDAFEVNSSGRVVRLILRTRETTEELKKRIETSNIFVCERHFKPECILVGKRIFMMYVYHFIHLFISQIFA